MRSRFPRTGDTLTRAAGKGTHDFHEPENAPVKGILHLKVHYTHSMKKPSVILPGKKTETKKSEPEKPARRSVWGEQRDLNPQPLEPQSSALTN